VEAPRRRVGYGSGRDSEDAFVENGYGKHKKKIEVEEDLFPDQTESLAALRTRMKGARDQLGRHRNLLDRYLPVHFDPDHDVNYEVENKYGELVQRMPQLDYNYRSRVSRGDDDEPVYTHIEPYRPAPRPPPLEQPTSSLPPIRNNFTPKLSDTRKRARSVLCKIKGDPRYFDFS